MDRQLKISYETMGCSSYMTVTCPSEADIINYQLEMILSNEIKNFLSVSRQIMDGEMVLYYNITSRIPLSQVLEKRKLKRKELIRLIEGAIAAIRDASEFRLPGEEIIMEAEYIYVNPATCEPAFLFLPIQGASKRELKDLISDLVFCDQIEMSNDNLIQILLKELNSQPFSLDRLENSIKPYRAAQPSMGQQSDRRGVSQGMAGQQPSYWQQNNGRQTGSMAGHPYVSQPYTGQTPASQPYASQSPAGQPYASQTPADQPSASQLNGKPQPSAPDTSKGKKSKAVSETDEESGFNPEKAKKMFMLPQAVIMVALAAAVSFGLFQDEAGALVINNILAAVILVVLIEVILYREAYVNSKKPKKKKAKEKSSGKAKKSKSGSSRPTPPGVSKPIPPMPQPVSQPVSQPMPQLGAQSAPQPQQPIPQPMPTPQPVSMGQSMQPAAQPFYNAGPQFQGMPYGAFGGSDDTDIGSETEIWDGASVGGMSAHLEYFENGKLTRIPIDGRNGTVIGRLETQVDFAVKSPRVGKVHAKFFCQDGQCFVMDINSKNGTYINGSRARIESNVPYPVHDNDRVMLADSEFTIRCTEN